MGEIWECKTCRGTNRVVAALDWLLLFPVFQYFFFLSASASLDIFFG